MVWKSQSKESPRSICRSASSRRRAPVPIRSKASGRVNLLAVFPWLKWLVTRRWFQFCAIVPNLAFFLFFVIAGLFGSPVGNRNIIIVFVWIFWWFLLIGLMVPFASRLWCTVCPLPFFGDWIQRGAVARSREGNTTGFKNKFFGLNKKWPKALSNIWLQNFGFLALCTFSVPLVTRPIVSVGVLGSLFVVAAAMALIWRLRTFCNYVCPISGFLSLYSMSSTIELRSLDPDTCLKCKDKGCIRGAGERGWACPWGVYMGKLDRNNYCGLCFECVKTCPNDNIGLMLRPFASDTNIKGYDESWKAFIMLGLSIVYSVTLLGPWGTLKDAANPTESGQWGRFAIYAASVWTLTLLAIPFLYYVSARIGKAVAGRGDVTMKRTFLAFSYTLVPLGLMAWIAFSIPLIMVNGSYILSTLSDPMGRGWDLVGTAKFPWTPLLPQWVPYIQVPVLLLGLYFAVKRGFKVGADLYGDRGVARRAMAPVSVFLLLVTVALFKLFIG